MKRALPLVLSLLPLLSSARALASADTRLQPTPNIALGGDAAYLLRPDGTTWAWGNNGAGQLGDGTSTTRMNPTSIAITCNQVSAGESFVLCIAPDSTLYSWGLNGASQLGRTGSIYFPASVGSTSDWRSIQAGYDHGLGIKLDGTLWAWGNNSSGQLGLNDTTKRTTPKKVGSDSNWMALAAGMGFSLALKADGTLWGTGLNSSGQMANGTTSTVPKIFTQIGTWRWKAISAGLSHVMAIREDGQLYVWGGNANGQIGDNSTTVRTSPYKITAAGPWRTMSAGWTHSVAIAANGTLWAWGDNTHGELGRGNTTSPQKKPVQIGTSSWNQVVVAGNSTTMLMEVDGTLLTYGAGAYGVLGIGTADDHSSWVVPWVWYEGDAWNYGNKPQLPGAGSYHSMLVGRDGNLRTWGENRYGQLGDGTQTNSSDNWTPAIRTYEGPWIFASGSEQVTHAIKSDGTLWGWGTNGDGELGIPSVPPGQGQALLTPTKIGTTAQWVKTAEHYEQMIALRADGYLYACGDNFHGLLGIGSTTNANSLQQVVTPDGKRWAAVAVSEDNGYGIMTEGTLWAWGDNASSQLGRGTKDPAAGVTTPKIVDGGFTDWVAVGAGLGWAVAVRANGQAYTLGSAPNGHSTTPKLVAGGFRMTLLATSRFSVLATGASGAILGWGTNGAGELGMETTSSVTTVQQTDYWGIRAAAGGADHFVAVDATTQDGHASGYNTSGQLGDGSNLGRDYPVSISFPYSF